MERDEPATRISSLASRCTASTIGSERPGRYESDDAVSASAREGERDRSKL